jgi:hypothetical protein
LAIQLTIVEVSPRSQKALDYAQDAVKQLLSLATGIIALTLTFFKNFAGSNSPSARVVMLIAWIVLALSIVFGVLGLFSMTSNLWPKQATDRAGTPPDIWTSDLRTMAIVQVVLFGSGFVLVLVAGGMAL